MSGQATLARSANGSAGRSTAAMNKAKGVSTSVRTNRMQDHQTPRTGTFNAGVLQTKRMNINDAKTGKRVGKATVRIYAKGSNKFQAPAKMPGRLNNTAAAAIHSKRVKSAGVAIGLTVPYVGVGAGAGAFAQGKAIGGRNNNYASLRLKASGYKVAGTGFGGKIKPASGREVAKAKARLGIKQARAGAGGAVTTNTTIKVTDRMTGGTYKAPATVTVKQVNKGAKAKSASGSKGGKGKSGSGGNKTGRKNFRPRRDGNGKFAGSY